MENYIFIHGLGQTGASWDKVIQELALPLSDGSAISCPQISELLENQEYTYGNLYRAFSEYCERSEGTLHLCGLSAGAILALHYAIDHPEKMGSVVLIAAQYEMPKMLLKFQSVLFRLMPEKTFESMGFQKKDFIRLSDSMAELNFKKELSKMECPALILCGEHDRANQKAAKGLAERMKNAEYRTIPNAGHEANMDNPQELAALIGRFFSG